ncbi:XRCC4-like factor-domain-containing protein [Staphylotrichum tortipilum]|uniref:Non-homologous end-joining factor 1 n=1 Tax=Staphylotrichum tortipilum TaxID=2831512 RepID=A0AAN6RRA3_9PEZI|nr:XRCC4-like factor-domain-containing protein [Staphylotrichum longicolle]
MAVHPSWRLLPAAAPGIPTLLVSAAFAANSYSIHLSDLANVWVEKLDRRPIIKRGMVEDTSIDPSDGPDQIRRLLELLRAAFDNTDPEHPTTSLTLARDDDGDSLVVNVTCVLPKPLKPFRWPMRLKKCPQSTIASELVLPMVQAHDARTREIGQLMSLLREKDAVITRLIDKLEATGTGLEHVFNALSGKRKVSRATTESKVKGLAPFSESDFKRTTAELHPVAQSTDVSALLSTVFGSTGVQYKSDLDVEPSSVLNDWWTKLSTGSNVILSGITVEKAASQRTPAAPEPEPIKDDDDFQIQATPPGARSALKRASAPQPADNDETSDGEDAADEVPVPSPPPAKPRARIGAIGKTKRPSPSPSPPPATLPPKSAVKPSDEHSDMASEADAASSPPPPPETAPRRGGLGRIGGKPKNEPPPPAGLPSPPPAPAEEPSSQLPRRHKLGMIGKKAASPAPEATPTVDDEARGRSKTPAAGLSKKEPVRETSQERADRKREELRKEMERKAAAGPAKKKRKF